MTLSGARILVDGATGYLGGHFVDQFLKSGAKVRALVRPESSHEKLAYLSNLPVEIVVCALDSEECEKAFQDVDIAAHLIGSIAPGRLESFENLHIEKSRRFASLARSCHRVLMVTALGASKHSESNYLRTKAQAEEAMKEALGPVPLAVLRPSLIVGRTVGFRHSKLVKRYIDLIRSGKPFLPLVGGGNNLIQPVFVEDLARAAVKIVEGRSQGVFELGGLESLSMRDFVLRLSTVLKERSPCSMCPRLWLTWQPWLSLRSRTCPVSLAIR